nr:immunoglobulin light chain junction region [Macaca mulatta]
CLLYFISARVF